MARQTRFLAFRSGVDRAPESLPSALEWIAKLLAVLGTHPPEPIEGPQPHGHVPTEVDNGRIVTPFGLAPSDLSDALRKYWPESLWTDAARVAYPESAGWKRNAERNTLAQAGGRCNVPIGYINGVRIVSEDSVGYFQINVCSHGHDREYWLDVDNNVRGAYEIYRSEGWGAWQFTARSLGLID